IKRLPVDPAAALNARETVSAVVFDNAFNAGFDGQFLRAEELGAIDISIHDPTVEVTFLLGIGDRNRLQVMAIFEIGVYVGVPIELVYDEIKVLVFVTGHVLD